MIKKTYPFLILFCFTVLVSNATVPEKKDPALIYCLSEFGYRKNIDVLGADFLKLARMSRLKLPIPPGFILTSRVSDFYIEHNKCPENLNSQILSAINTIERNRQKEIDSRKKPLLLSIRQSINKLEIPTVITNVGLNDMTVESLKNLSGSSRFAYDNYRRLIQNYAYIVLEIEPDKFDNIIDTYVASKSIDRNCLSEADFCEIIKLYKKKIEEISGKSFPQDIFTQINDIISSILNKWKTLKINNTANDRLSILVQEMIFGNFTASGTGEVFTRNPVTGTHAMFGCFFPGDNGESFITGSRLLWTISKNQAKGSNQQSLEKEIPSIYKQLLEISNYLERNFRDAQLIEFIVQHGKLWVMQTCNAERGTTANMKILIDMVKEEFIEKNEAINRFKTSDLEKICHKSLPAEHNLLLLGADGLPAAPGAAIGKIVLSSNKCVVQAEKGEKVILVMNQTSADDMALLTK